MTTTDTAVAAPTPANWASVIALGLIWGGTFAIVSVALRGYGPVTVAAARTTLGALALLSMVIASGRPVPRTTPALAVFVVVIGVTTSALPFLLLSWGQQYVPSAFAGLSMAMLPLFVLPLAHRFVPGDRLTRRRAVGFALGRVGALVLLGPDIALGGGDRATLGRLACLAATVSYAAGSILTRRCPPVDGLWLSALTLAVGAVILVPAMLAVEGMPGAAEPGAVVAIVVLGLVSTALAASLWVQVIRSAGPSFMTLVNYQVPLWSVAFGTLLLGEILAPRFFAALALIACGLLVAGSGRGMRGHERRGA